MDGERDPAERMRADLARAEAADAEKTLDVERWLAAMRKVAAHEGWNRVGNKPPPVIVSGDMYYALADHIPSRVGEPSIVKGMTFAGVPIVKPSPTPPVPCRHNLNTGAEVNVVFVEDIGRYVADVRVKCLDCGSRFRWLGLPMGLDYDNPTVSPDGFECRLPLAPEGESVPPISGAKGFRIRRMT